MAQEAVGSGSGFSTTEQEESPVILWFTPFTGESGRFKTCGESTCFFTDNRTYLSHARTRVNKSRCRYRSLFPHSAQTSNRSGGGFLRILLRNRRPAAAPSRQPPVGPPARGVTEEPAHLLLRAGRLPLQLDGHLEPVFELPPIILSRILNY